MMDNHWQNKVSLWLRELQRESWAADLAPLPGLSPQATQDKQNAETFVTDLVKRALFDKAPGNPPNGASFHTPLTLTHPLVEGCSLAVPFDDAQSEAIGPALAGLLRKDLDELERLAGNSSNVPEAWAKTVYFYLFFALHKRLRRENVGGLGGAWELLPADSRMPDHSLWRHLGLTSAMGTCRAEGSETALAVFAITPVQAFIGKARKLRDYWVGSVILSYLAFADPSHVADTLGPDHIVYPSLHDQSLVETWIGRDFHLARFLAHREQGEGIASFPNKFVFLAPASQAGEICKAAEEAVQREWLRLAGLVKAHFAKEYDWGSTFARLFDHQISDYWQFNHAACRLAGLAESDRKALDALLHPGKWQDEARLVADIAKNGDDAGNTRLYGASHTLAQSLLAAAKLKPPRLRKPQEGEKCPLCGEHEVLHDFAEAGKTSAAAYHEAVGNFWKRLRDKENGGPDSFAQVGKNERLCAVCAIKRFLPKVMKKRNEEPLADMFGEADKFPSTTETAYHRYLEDLKKLGVDESKRRCLIDELHTFDTNPGEEEQLSIMREIAPVAAKRGVTITDRDKYYALLLMDGDKMGDLINGKTLSATWADIVRPDLRANYEALPHMQEIRLLDPALHATISDGLNSFARHGVAPVVQRHDGRLIYAGGDDVCAILPLNEALEAADAIRRAYNMGFVRYTADGAEELGGECAAGLGKLGLHLGNKADKISISGAILIAHHKEPLREVLREAHAVLEGIAKERAGRNALAIRLKKRSGGDRDLWFRWDARNPYNDETLLASLEAVMDDVNADALGGSLLYRLADLKQAIAPLAVDQATLKANRENIVRLIAYEVEHSGKLADKDKKNEKARRTARRLAGLMVTDCSGDGLEKGRAERAWYNPEAAIIAHFLAPARRTA